MILSSPTCRSPQISPVVQSIMAISSPGTGLPRRTSSVAPSESGATCVATRSCSRAALSTQSVSSPAIGSGKQPAMHTSAIPNAGKAPLGESPNRSPAAKKLRNVSGSTGSAPFSQTRIFERSSSSSVLRMARAAREYEKFGPAVPVPPYCEIHCNQRKGRARKSCGAPCTKVQPIVMGMVSSPTSPIS
ncbi:unannotated protein [freshwater metagenome]|uniref:Unannotated protein n=1 Tax=freshwater metagenome TaxID=449393 RepID=A0A6J6D2R6_9ZZZZ